MFTLSQHLPRHWDSVTSSSTRVGGERGEEAKMSGLCPRNFGQNVSFLKCCKVYYILFKSLGTFSLSCSCDFWWTFKELSAVLLPFRDELWVWPDEKYTALSVTYSAHIVTRRFCLTAEFWVVKLKKNNNNNHLQFLLEDRILCCMYFKFFAEEESLERCKQYFWQLTAFPLPASCMNIQSRPLNLLRFSRTVNYVTGAQRTCYSKRENFIHGRLRKIKSPNAS